MVGMWVWHEGTGVPKHLWLGKAMPRLMWVCACVWCHVSAKGEAFGPPRWGVYISGHGRNAREAD